MEEMTKEPITENLEETAPADTPVTQEPMETMEDYAKELYSLFRTTILVLSPNCLKCDFFRIIRIFKLIACTI